MVETERNLRASYGHDVECAWLVLDAADALGRYLNAPGVREALLLASTSDASEVVRQEARRSLLTDD